MANHSAETLAGENAWLANTPSPDQHPFDPKVVLAKIINRQAEIVRWPATLAAT